MAIHQAWGLKWQEQLTSDELETWPIFPVISQNEIHLYDCNGGDYYVDWKGKEAGKTQKGPKIFGGRQTQ